VARGLARYRRPGRAAGAGGEMASGFQVQVPVSAGNLKFPLQIIMTHNQYSESIDLDLSETETGVRVLWTPARRRRRAFANLTITILSL
jgi:hypothetical protein